MKEVKDTTEDCWLEFNEEGVLGCTFNHKAGDECLALICKYCCKLACECYEETK